jgi:hypothetical protein
MQDCCGSLLRTRYGGYQGRETHARQQIQSSSRTCLLLQFLKDAMATNHSNIGNYFADKHLGSLTKMVSSAKKSKGEELFKPGGSPEGRML